MMSDEPKFVTTNYVCAGIRNYKGKKLMTFELIDTKTGQMIHDEPLALLSTSKLVKSCIVGGVYEIDVTETGIYGKARFQHEFKGNSEDLFELEREHEIALNQLATRAMEKKIGSPDMKLIHEMLDPVRKAYRNTNPQGKAAILAMVIQSIQR